MRLVARALEQLQGGAAPRQLQRIGPSGEKHLLLLLRQADDRQLVLPQGPRRVDRRPELTLAAVDHHQIGERLLLGDAATQVARDDFVYRGEVVLRCPPDPEATVLALLGPSRLEPDQRSDGIPTLIGRTVVAPERRRDGR